MGTRNHRRLTGQKQGALEKSPCKLHQDWIECAMPSTKKRPGQRRKASRSKRSGTDKSLGNQADLMQAMARGLGNRELAQRLERATGQRDAMLAFIAERLRQVRNAQLQESALLHQKDKWWRDAAWREPGVWSPEPERWAAVAKEYRQAIEALCRGQLSRGAELLERAMEAERTAIESVPHGLGIHPDEEGEQGDVTEGPDTMQDIGDGEGCPADPSTEACAQHL